MKQLLSCFCLCFSLIASGEPSSTLDLSIKSSSGTGFLVDSSGYLVTAWHVIKNKKQVYVGPVVGTLWKEAKIVKIDEKNDLALIKISQIDRSPLEIADWQTVPLGLEAYLISFPIPKFLGLTKKMTQGLVNGSRTDFSGEGLFQYSAETQKGSSGAPVLSPDGLVLGVVQKKVDGLKLVESSKDLPENINYAIKSNLLVKFLESTEVKFAVKKVNLDSKPRPYQLFQTANGAIFSIIARDDIKQNSDTKISPSE
jgi:S1-C subfamily serine protease